MVVWNIKALDRMLGMTQAIDLPQVYIYTLQYTLNTQGYIYIVNDLNKHLNKIVLNALTENYLDV